MSRPWILATLYIAMLLCQKCWNRKEGHEDPESPDCGCWVEAGEKEKLDPVETNDGHDLLAILLIDPLAHVQQREEEFEAAVPQDDCRLLSGEAAASIFRSAFCAIAPRNQDDNFLILHCGRQGGGCELDEAEHIGHSGGGAEQGVEHIEKGQGGC